MNNETIQNMIDQGALFFVSHSGGKDSQAMYSYLQNIVPHNQIIVVHADLGEVEWTGIREHIENNIDHELNVITAQFRDGSRKDFISMVERRIETRPEVAPWPSPKHRQCTSDLKRDPIHKFIRNVMKDRGASLAVNCTGIRAEESSSRAKLNVWEECKRLCTADRTVYEWRPIHDLTTEQVFEMIADAGQEPFHAYKENERLSCVFCIMGCTGDLRHGAKQRPELARKLIEIETRTGFTMFHGKSLESVVGDLIATDAQ